MLALLVYSCNSGGNSNDGARNDKSSINGEVSTALIATLDEEEELLGVISSFAFVTKSSFVVSTKGGAVVTYDLNGNRINSFSNIGTGPFEYLSPSKIKVYDKKIYVWCSQQLKLIVFDLNGKPLEEYNRFSTAIKDFVVVNDELYFFMSGGSLYSLIEVYNLDSQEVIAYYGEEDRESEILSMLTCSGGLATRNGNIYFSSVGKLGIEKIQNGAISMQKTISDKEFEVKKLEDANYGRVRGDTEARVNYVNKNSYVGGIFVINDRLIIKAEVGEFVYEDVWDSKTWNTSDRFEKYFVLDEDLNVIATYKRPFSFQCKNCLYAENGDDLFFLSEVENADGSDFQYQLNKLSFSLNTLSRTN
ncbi:6-bladed beta-propeller [uncultured Roseivirga sp.]|uniref:6-bladed beta-propeller n=1 Tax=uncultured Roseivirga sp. TaxID=543088 RepID=UPI0030D8EE32|tara:strand:+ start:60313 stop:61395 length:1083 start_codon:yes stop_codon:yes gene_type:complete